jgi:uncharacterized membrane protein YgcG
VWGVTPAAAALCLARGMEHAALLSALGNVAAAVAAGGCVVYFLGSLAHDSWHGTLAPLASAFSAWNVDAGDGGDGVPVPAAALASCASGFLIHFALPAVEAAMTTPRRVMEATGRGFGFAGVVLIAFGLLGALATGPAPPRVALSSLGGGAVALVLRFAAALDALTTAPVLCRPALMVCESLWERATESRLRGTGSAVVRCAFVAAAAAAAAAPASGSIGTVLPMVAGAAAVVCALVFPPLMLLVGADAEGAPLVRTSGVERGAAASIAFLGCCACVFGTMALAGSVIDVPFPYTAPPAPPPLDEYDYSNTASLYAFSRDALPSSDVNAVADAASAKNSPGGNPSGPGSGPGALQNLSAAWANGWNHSWAPSGGGGASSDNGGQQAGGNGGNSGGGAAAGAAGGGSWENGHWMMLPGATAGASSDNGAGAGGAAAGRGGAAAGGGGGGSDDAGGVR